MRFALFPAVVGLVFSILVPGCKTETAADAKPKLISAINANDAAKVKSILASHPELAKATNEHRVPMLVLATTSNNPEVIGALLDNGADAKDGGPGKNAPLLLALSRNAPGTVVKLLLDRGADPNSRSSLGVTPLMAAAQGGGPGSVEALLDKGADVNAVAPLPPKWSVLHYAVTGGNADLVALLLRKGAKPDAKDAEGRTPLQLAQSAAVPQKTPEQEDEEVRALAQSDPDAAAKLAAQIVVRRASQATSPMAGKDMSKVISVLQNAGGR